MAFHPERSSGYVNGRVQKTKEKLTGLAGARAVTPMQATCVWKACKEIICPQNARKRTLFLHTGQVRKGSVGRILLQHSVSGATPVYLWCSGLYSPVVVKQVSKIAHLRMEHRCAGAVVTSHRRPPIDR